MSWTVSGPWRLTPSASLLLGLASGLEQVANPGQMGGR